MLNLSIMPLDEEHIDEICQDSIALGGIYTLFIITIISEQKTYTLHRF